MGNDGRRGTSGEEKAAADNHGEWPAWRTTCTTSLPRDAATLERYLEIPTFRRQGRRLSCR